MAKVSIKLADGILLCCAEYGMTIIATTSSYVTIGFTTIYGDKAETSKFIGSVVPGIYTFNSSEIVLGQDSIYVELPVIRTAYNIYGVCGTWII